MKNKITAIIVDDEPIAREGIRVQLARYPEVQLIAECENGPEAVTAIEQLVPDLLFLDVQMPGMNGFEVLQVSETPKAPTVIFVTAFDQFAVKAFEVNAVDYLLKPFDDERFRKAFERARSKIYSTTLESLDQKVLKLLDTTASARTFLERLVVKSQGRIFFLPVNEIDWMESADNYVSLHTGVQAHLIRDTLTSLEDRLDPRHFVRIRSSAIVNIERVKELRPLFKGEFEVVLKNGTKLRTSRRYREKLTRMLDHSYEDN